MKMRHIIRKDLSIEHSQDKKKDVIKVIDAKKEHILSELISASYVWNKWIFNEDYIVAYIHDNGNVLINGVYDIQSKSLVTLTPTTRFAIEYMFLSRRQFDLGQVLAEINEQDLKLLSEEEKGFLRRYLTLNNPRITNQQVIDYILLKYPSLENYRNIREVLTVARYREIQKELENPYFFFHAMPQRVENCQFEEITKVEKLPYDPTSIYTAEYENIKRLRRLKEK